MKEQEIILIDKWIESKYHLKRMKEKWFEIQSENADKSKFSRDFKFEFNSFVNSCRSITFVLQKCFKNKAEGFENWYEKIQEELKQNDFAKMIVELRNINQKEGNKYPDIIEIKIINKFFQSEITYSPIPDNKSQLFDKIKLTENQKKLIPINLIDFNIVPRLENFEINLVYDNISDESYEETCIKMEELLVRETLKEISIKISEITEEEIKNSYKIPNKLRIKNNTYSWEAFYNECNKLLSYYKEKCRESVELFA